MVLISKPTHFPSDSSSTARTKPSGVTSVEASPPALSFESKINHDGPFCALY